MRGKFKPWVATIARVAKANALASRLAKEPSWLPRLSRPESGHQPQRPCFGGGFFVTDMLSLALRYCFPIVTHKSVRSATAGPADPMRFGVAGRLAHRKSFSRWI